ncbi:MAG: DUF4450 domain-containing protein [Ruminiclostridium sp.]|nr:DUF4450 domain-containing protein [Ruminiclostridium sp.]
MNSKEIESVFNCYIPEDKGFCINISGKITDSSTNDGKKIGIVNDNPRLHRRPLYPPTDKSMIWDGADLERLGPFGFRPLVVAYNGPRFMFDFHIAGGILGHLLIGVIVDGKTGKWLHEWSDIRLSYTEGRMDYIISDPQFPGMEVFLSAAALCGAAGLIVKACVKGAKGNIALIWAYGGASAIYDNHVLDDEEYRFKPEHCKKDFISILKNSFELNRAFDATDTYISAYKAVAGCIPGWKARVAGGCSGECILGFGEPDFLLESPEKLVNHTDFNNEMAPDGKMNCVVVSKVEINREKNNCFIAVGMGGNIRKVIADPEGAWTAARDRNKQIAGRVVVKTPDEYLDSAVSMAAFITDAIWGDETFMHGAWSWRSGYLGWRGWYGPTCYGWLDRVKKAIGNHIRLCRNLDGDDRGALGHNLESGEGLYFNMNEVFIDQIRQYLDYSNDVGSFEEIFDVVEGIVDWENRRLRPSSLPLYENSLNTWISDSHWNIRGICTQVSAYMYRAYSLLAELAKRIGKDHTSYEKAAADIKAAMNDVLWLKRKGIYAEYIDMTGYCQIHQEPELATIYHPVEFETADEFKTSQMLYWADQNLRKEHTPGEGLLYWSSNWFPNKGRTSTHSTYILAYGEELNFALTNLTAGRPDKAYSIIRGCLCGFFNGPAPGGLACQMKEDGRQLYNEDFADANSMFGRTVVEGLFGIVPRKLDNKIRLTPMFPWDWKEASIKTPQLCYSFKRENGGIVISWESPEEIILDLRMPVMADKILGVKAEGKEKQYLVEPGIGFSWVKCVFDRSCSGEITISYIPRSCVIYDKLKVKQFETFSLELLHSDNAILYDPQGVLDNTAIGNGKLKGTAAGEPGAALVFIRHGSPECPYWVQVEFEISSVKEPDIKNMWVSPSIKERNLRRWSLVDIGDKYNASSPEEVIKRVAECAIPPEKPASTVGFKYWKAHLIDMCLKWENPPIAEAWREKTGQDGVAWTSEGIPIKTSKTGPNLAVVTLAGGYPEGLEFPVNERGQILYLMVTGMTFPNQSHVINLRVRLHYEDGDIQTHDLYNPDDIGDCWGTVLGRFHDTRNNGFENIGGRFGPPGSNEAGNLLKPVSVDTEAHLLSISMRENVILKRVEVEAVANDAFYAVMGISVYRAEL